MGNGEKKNLKDLNGCSKMWKHCITHSKYFIIIDYYYYYYYYYYYLHSFEIIQNKVDIIVMIDFVLFEVKF